MLDWRRHGSEHPSGFLRLKAFQPRTHSSNPCSLADIVFLMPQCCAGLWRNGSAPVSTQAGGRRFKSFWPYLGSLCRIHSCHQHMEELKRRFSPLSCSSYLRILCQQESLELSDCNSAEWSGATKNSWASVSNGPFKHGWWTFQSGFRNIHTHSLENSACPCSVLKGNHQIQIKSTMRAGDKAPNGPRSRGFGDRSFCRGQWSCVWAILPEFTNLKMNCSGLLSGRSGSRCDFADTMGRID